MLHLSIVWITGSELVIEFSILIGICDWGGCEGWGVWGPQISEDDVTSLSESFNLNLNNVAYVKELLQLLDRLRIKDNTRNSYIETAVDTNFLVVLNEGLNHDTLLKVTTLEQMLVDEGIFDALVGLKHDFLKNGHFSIIQLSMLVEFVFQLQLEVTFGHFWVHLL